MAALFPQQFLDAISRLSLTIEPAPRGRRVGSHLSPQAGQSLEFRDFRPYAPGDDLRRIDWNLYARTRDLVVRQFERPTAVPVFILVDNSRSMHAESPSRYASAARAAAAIAFAATGAGNTVHTFTTHQGTLNPLRPASERKALADVLAGLSQAIAADGQSIATAVSAAARTTAAHGTGVFFVISDFFEPAGVDVLLTSLRQITHRLVVLQITQPWDANPTLAGTMRLSDSETDGQLQIHVDRDMRTRYQTAYHQYFDAMTQGITARGARHLMIDASADTLNELAQLFPAGRLAV